MWNDFCARLFRQNEFAVKLGLENVKRGLAKANNPHFHHKRIFVGGTNGKGLTAAAISNILQAHGFRVGFFSSPHIVSFEERFRVNGCPLKRDQVMTVGNQVLERLMDAPLTYFEICTVLAATIFADEQVDIGVYEIGLGGRLDAVRGLAPASLVAMTTLGYDHMDYLGTSLESICGEKAALFEENVPCIVGQQEYPEALQYLTNIAHRVKAEIHIVPEVPVVKENPHMARHCATATLATKVFLKSHFDQALCDKGLSALRWPGRFDRRREFWGPNTDVLFDAAHNADGVRALVNYVQDSFAVERVVFSCMKDKDIPSIIAILQQLKVPVWACILDNPRAASRKQLSIADTILTPEELQMAKPQGKTLVCGSIYLLGALLPKEGGMTIWVD